MSFSLYLLLNILPVSSVCGWAGKHSGSDNGDTQRESRHARRLPYWPPTLQMDFIYNCYVVGYITAIN